MNSRNSLASIFFITAVSLAISDYATAAPNENLSNKKGFQGFTSEQICRAAISTIMGRPIKTIKSRVEVSGFVYASYVRSNDGERFEYQCEMHPSNIVWRTKINGAWGRWRNDARDSVISYSADGANLIVRESPGATEKFSLGDLK